MNDPLSLYRFGNYPTLDRITAIGIKSDSVEQVFSDMDEKKLLEQFWTFLNAQAVPPTLITYNGPNLDVPFLVVSVRFATPNPHYQRTAIRSEKRR